MGLFGPKRPTIVLPQTKEDVWSPATLTGGGFSLDLRRARVHNARDLISEVDKLSEHLTSSEWLADQIPSFAAAYRKRPVRLDDCRWVNISACNWSFPTHRDKEGNVVLPAYDAPRAPQVSDKELVELLLRFPGVKVLSLKNQVSLSENGLLTAIRNLHAIEQVILGPETGNELTRARVRSKEFRARIDECRSTSEIGVSFADHPL